MSGSEEVQSPLPTHSATATAIATALPDVSPIHSGTLPRMGMLIDRTRSSVRSRHDAVHEQAQVPAEPVGHVEVATVAFAFAQPTEAGSESEKSYSTVTIMFASASAAASV